MPVVPATPPARTTEPPTAAPDAVPPTIDAAPPAAVDDGEPPVTRTGWLLPAAIEMPPAVELIETPAADAMEMEPPDVVKAAPVSLDIPRMPLAAEIVTAPADAVRALPPLEERSIGPELTL